MKEIIHDVLFDQLATKSYDAEAAAQWTKDIADIIERKIKGNIYLFCMCILYVQFTLNYYI